MPSISNADFDLDTITGEMYTNLDFAIEGEEDRLMHVGGQRIEVRLNMGRQNIQLETIIGNICLRKMK